MFRVVGQAALADKRWDKAFDYFEFALSIEGKVDPVLLNNSGVALLGKQEEVAALRRFRKAAQIDRAYAEAYANIGRVLLNRRKFNDALAAITYAVEIDPNSSTYWTLQGRVFESLDKPKRAAACYEQAANIDSNNAYNRSRHARSNLLSK